MYGFTTMSFSLWTSFGDQLYRTLYWSPWQWNQFADLDLKCLIFSVWSQWVESHSRVLIWIRVAECQSNPSCLTQWCVTLVKMLCMWVILVCNYLVLTLTLFECWCDYGMFPILRNNTGVQWPLKYDDNNRCYLCVESLSNRCEISSGHWALLGGGPVNNLSTPWTVMVIGGMGWWPYLVIELFANCLRLSVEVFETTDSNCLLSMLAFDTGSKWVWPSEFSGAISMFSVFFCKKIVKRFLVTRSMCVRKDNWL